MAKYACVFLAGMIFGIMGTGIVTLTILDNRMDSLEPSIREMNYQILVWSEDIKGLRSPIKEIHDLTINANLVMRDCIKIGHEEMNNYNRIFVESIGR